MIIDVKITGQLLEATVAGLTDPVIAEKAKGKHFCRVEADGEWDGMAMRLIYRSVTAAGEIAREAIVVDRAAVPIPAEVLRAGRLYISAVGLADSGNERLTTADMRIGLKVWPVALIEAAAADAALTPSQYEQLLSVYNLLRSDVGDMSNLDTSTQISIVDAINELHEGAQEEMLHRIFVNSALQKLIKYTVTAYSSFGIAYEATVDDFGSSSDGLDSPAVPIGTEIILVPQSTNQGEPTLSINEGEAYPLCLRPGWNVDGNDLRPVKLLPIRAGMLLRGAEYVFRFDGGSWVLQSYVDRPASGDIPVGAVSPIDIRGVTWLNWFDYEDHINHYEANKYIDPKNGVISDLNGWYVFPKIYLLGGKTYTMSGSMRNCVLYNATDGAYISTIRDQSPTASPVTFAVDAAYTEVYIRFSHNGLNNIVKEDFMIVEGESLPDSYVPHEAQIPWLSLGDKTLDGAQLMDGTVDGDKLKNGTVDGDKLESQTITADKLCSYAGAKKNLYNYRLADTSLWHSANGTGPTTLTDYFASPLIPVEPGKTYCIYALNAKGNIQLPHSAFEVSRNGVYTKLTLAAEELSGKDVSFTAGADAAYVAFNARNTYLEAFAVTEQYLPYIPPYLAEHMQTLNRIQGHYAGGLMVALGDSITRGCSNGETLEDGTVLANGGQIPKPYGVYAAELLGMACKNFGVDGATVKTVLARINSTDYMAGLKAQPDIITVKIGTNDMAQVPLGTIDDVYDAANVSYYGGLKEIARLLSEGFPESAIVFITPLRANENARSYVKAMEEVAELYDIHCMQMHKVMRYMQQNADGSYYINDHYNGLHPNQAAHLRMGRALAGFLKSV